MFGDQQQCQQGGDGAFQIQCIIHNNGIDEKRARELVKEEQQRLEKRVRKWLSLAGKKLLRENLLEALSDPAFLIEVENAKRTAASTDREWDYELLSELLLHRARDGENRYLRAGMAHAITVVDKIADEALCGITVSFLISSGVDPCLPVRDRLNWYKQLFEKICTSNLPENPGWLDHVNLLNIALCYTGVLARNDSFLDIFGKHFPECGALGVDTRSDKYREFLDMLHSCSIPEAFIVDNELLPGHVLVKQMPSADGQPVLYDYQGNRMTLNEEQKNCLNHAVQTCYDQDEKTKKELIRKLEQAINEHLYLQRVSAYHNRYGNLFSLTMAGKVLAYANAKLLFPELPDIQLT